MSDRGMSDWMSDRGSSRPGDGDLGDGEPANTVLMTYQQQGQARVLCHARHASRQLCMGELLIVDAQAASGVVTFLCPVCRTRMTRDMRPYGEWLRANVHPPVGAVPPLAVPPPGPDVLRPLTRDVPRAGAPTDVLGQPIASRTMTCTTPPMDLCVGI